MIGNSLRALPEQCQLCEEDGNNAVVGGLGDQYDEVNDQTKCPIKAQQLLNHSRLLEQLETRGLNLNSLLRSNCRS